jgi:hypothetical protein
MGAPGQMSSQGQAAQAIQQNMLLRQALLGSAPTMRKNLGSFTTPVGATNSPGGTTRVKLFNVGVTTRLLLDVTMTYDVVTAAMVATGKAPFNIMNRVKLTDFDGTDRVNCSGYQLFVWNCVRRRMYYGYNNGTATGVLTSPIQPLTTGTVKTCNFMIEVPLAFDPATDLRGALLTQTAVGEAWLSVDWNPTGVSTTANDDAIFTSATGTLANVSFTLGVFQEYLLPQAINGQVPLPTFDLMTVYEFNGALRSSDNIAIGSEKLFNYPNVRSVIGAYFNYIQNSILNAATTDITRFRLIANGNNVLKEYNARDKLFEQRIAMLDGTDIRPGTYFELHRQKPIETALFGNVQYGITPLLATATTNFEVAFESFYTKGSALPGLSQASG